MDCVLAEFVRLGEQASEEDYADSKKQAVFGPAHPRRQHTQGVVEEARHVD